MRSNRRMHLTGYSGLGPPPAAGDAERYAALDAARAFCAPWPLPAKTGFSGGAPPRPQRPSFHRRLWPSAQTLRSFKKFGIRRFHAALRGTALTRGGIGCRGSWGGVGPILG